MKIETFSGIMLTLLLIGMLSLVFDIQQVRASGTVFIRADGSVDPPTANITSIDNVTYTFTDNNYDEIVIERDNIVIDGVGYTVQGTGGGTGIDLSGRNNVTIKNLEINAFDYGIWLDYSSNNSIYGNNITTNPSNFAGIWVYNSSGNNIYSNNMTDNYNAIYLESSSYNSIHGNNLTQNYRGIMLSSMFGVSSNNNIYGNNIVDNWHGIRLQYSSNNSISQNYVANSYFGIWLYWSSNNTVSGNDIVANNLDGIRVEGSPHNNILGNQISNNYHGIEIRPYTGAPKSSNNTISRNNITTNSYYGVWIYWSPNNTIFHNNIIDNAEQVHINYDSPNIWDNGCEGNYWSDYSGIDSNGDGIGDTPYLIDASNQDNYPLMSPYVVGDLNHDGTVDINDLLLVDNAYGSEAGDTDWNCHCDITGPEEKSDGLIDIHDLATVGRNYGKTA